MNLVSIAAGTTIALNLLEIKENVQKIRVASHMVIKGSKVAGKKIKKVLTKQ